MKSINEIALMCGLTKDNIYRAYRQIHINPPLVVKRLAYFDEYQEHLIVEHLFYIGKIDSLIFESKMNGSTN